MFKKIINNTITRLIFGLLLGLLIGPYLNELALQIILSTKHILGQLILFLVPLIILGFVITSISSLNKNSTSIIAFALIIAYLSSLLAGFISTGFAYTILPTIDIPRTATALNKLPEMLFKLDIPPIMDVISTLVLSIMIGIGILWTNATPLQKAFDQLRDIVLELVNRVLLPILPIYIACNFALLSFTGSLRTQFPVFIKVIVVVIILHFLYLLLLYGIAGIYARKNPWQVLKYYGPTYLTALGTMSSAASLGTAIKSAEKSPILDKKVTDFTIPFFSNVHLCGGMITITFFVLAVSLIVYGALPALPITLTFVCLLGIFALGAPGVPGGTLMASLGLLTQMLGFDDTGIALVLTIFALQDSFGTACNIVGDGALTLIVDTYHKKNNMQV